MIVDGLVGTITFDVFHLLNSTHICQVILFLVVFTLGNIRVHVGNEASNIKPPIDEALHLHSILCILYVNPNNMSVTNFIQLVSSQLVDRFSQTKLFWKAPNEGYPHMCGMHKSDNK